LSVDSSEIYGKSRTIRPISIEIRKKIGVRFLIKVQRIALKSMMI
jgi:hypothetical protein